ncbi:tail fiber protein [Paenibacillus xylanexedens]|uniref:tail fiber protein n=1 Tax=Paenibacillus xylanexedens TaxID=528191 RepID=UPI000F536484|nr:tail fiber protein [Paenibacillus xylanexedens]
MDTKGTPADAQTKADAAKTAAIAAAAADLAAHKARGADEHPMAKGNAAGFMSAADKLKSDASTSAATPDTLMQRDAEGRAKVAAPAAADDIARKAETDAVQTKLDSHAADTVKHVTQAEHDKLQNIQAGAEVNQNAFSKINDVSAGSKTDTVTLVGGTGITITTDPANKRVSFTATGEATPGPHALSHIQGGTDVIPDAETGGVSGLMSGPDAQYLRVGVPERFDEIEEYVADQIAAIPPVNDATLTDKGIVQLSKSTTGDRDTIAATESAVGAVQHQVGNLAELQTTDKDNLVDALNEVFQSGVDGKNLIKSAVIVKGGTVAGTSPHSFAELTDGIGTIETATVIKGQQEAVGIFKSNIQANDPIKTRYNIEQKNVATNFANNGQSVRFSPDNRYMAVSVMSVGISMFKRIGDEYSQIPFPSISESTRYISFSPDSKFFAVPSLGAVSLRIFKIEEGDMFTEIKGFIIPSGRSNYTDFSSDGKYLAVSLLEDPCIAIYKIEGDTFTKLANPSIPPTNGAYGISFTPNADYLAVAHGGSNLASIYKRNGDVFTKLANLPSLPGTNNGYGLAFSHSGDHLFIGTSATPGLLWYIRNGDSFTKVNISSQATNVIYDIRCSQDDRYMAMTMYSSPYMSLYDLKNGGFSKYPNPSVLPTGIGYGVDFSPDSNFLGVAHGALPALTLYDMRDGVYLSSNVRSSISASDIGLGYAKESGIAGEAKKIVKIWS